MNNIIAWTYLLEVKQIAGKFPSTHEPKKYLVIPHIDKILDTLDDILEKYDIYSDDLGATYLYIVGSIETTTPDYLQIGTAYLPKEVRHLGELKIDITPLHLTKEHYEALTTNEKLCCLPACITDVILTKN